LQFKEELASVLPADLPNRDEVIDTGARHLELVEQTNRYMNLTRITSPREAAVKHVLDSVLPWRLFVGAGTVLDAGTGAGFPGIPLALVLDAVRFTLAESVQKKAQFVESAVEELQIPNVRVTPVRAEQLMKTEGFDIVTARAVAPLWKLIPLFASRLKRGTRMLLYKGADVQEEMDQSAAEAQKWRVRQAIVMREVLPDGFGIRTVVELRR
jgi:16S rRNA (guanine527-N7)-methyltransferase